MQSCAYNDIRIHQRLCAKSLDHCYHEATKDWITAIACRTLPITIILPLEVVREVVGPLLPEEGMGMYYYRQSYDIAKSGPEVECKWEL